MKLFLITAGFVHSTKRSEQFRDHPDRMRLSSRFYFPRFISNFISRGVTIGTSGLIREVLSVEVNFISNAYAITSVEHIVLVAQRDHRVRDVVDTAFIALDENTLVAEAAKALYAQERCTIVVTHLDASSGQRIPVGIITERDIIFRVVAQNRGPFKVTLKDIMSTPIITIDEDKSVREAIGILNKHRINRLPVVHDGSIIGIVTTGMIMSNISIEKHTDNEI